MPPQLALLLTLALTLCLLARDLKAQPSLSGKHTRLLGNFTFELHMLLTLELVYRALLSL